jgi:hypothetical protein|tara:strand:+ start:274 stop:555 length:282 start_codon:yes stop_codon:yes gene_type:complete
MSGGPSRVTKRGFRDLEGRLGSLEDKYVLASELILQRRVKETLLYQIMHIREMTRAGHLDPPFNLRYFIPALYFMGELKLAKRLYAQYYDLSK